MTKAQIIDYLKSELADQAAEYNKAHQEWLDASGGLDGIDAAINFDKVSTRYYYFGMICNDLGIKQ